MKYQEPSSFADPEVAMRKLLEIASTVEPVQDGRIHIEKINWPFLSEHGGKPAEYTSLGGPCFSEYDGAANGMRSVESLFKQLQQFSSEVVSFVF